MIESENIADKYYKAVFESKSPAKILLEMHVEISAEVIDRDKYTVLLKMFGKAVKVYGREIAYFATLDLADIDNINYQSVYPLYIYFCKKRLVEKIKHKQFQVDLDDYAERIKHKDVSPELLKNPLR